MVYTLAEFKLLDIDDLERAKFLLDASWNVAIRVLYGTTSWSNPVETRADLPVTGTVNGEAIVVRNDPVLGSTIAIRNQTLRVEILANDYNRVAYESWDIPDYLGAKLLAGAGISFTVSAGPNKTITIENTYPPYVLDCADVKDCIEAFTDLDLSWVIVTLWEICWNITFCVGWVTIDRTNTTNTGVQNFDTNYEANYTDVVINYLWDTIINYWVNTINNYYWTSNYYDTAIINYDWSTINIYGWSTFNIRDSYFNSTNNEYTYEWDTINYISSTLNYDESTINNFEWDIYVGWNIIIMNNEENNASTVIQTWAWVAYTDLNNVLLCDLAYAVATPIDPALKDYVKLIVSGVIAGNDLGQWITWGNPAVYGNSSQLRGNILTPAIVNASNFWCAFKFGDSKTIEVSDFGFTIPITDTILWVKVEVIFNSTVDTVSVDCITMTVYHTAGTPITEENIKKVTWISRAGWTSKAVTDADCTTGSVIMWRTVTTWSQVGFREFIMGSGSFTINSTAAETVTLSYVIYK